MNALEHLTLLAEVRLEVLRALERLSPAGAVEVLAEVLEDLRATNVVGSEALADSLAAPPVIPRAPFPPTGLDGLGGHAVSLPPPMDDEVPAARGRKQAG